MQKTHTYCPQCGHSIHLVEFEETYRLRCEDCGSEYYFDPKVSVVCVLQNNGKVLLIKRGNEPGYGKWSLPGGYVDRFEIVEDAAIREVYEETGLRIRSVELLAVYSTNDSPVIVIAYQASSYEGELNTNDEVLDSGFFESNNLPELAFPRDFEIIHTVLKG